MAANVTRMEEPARVREIECAAPAGPKSGGGGGGKTSGRPASSLRLMMINCQSIAPPLPVGAAGAPLARASSSLGRAQLDTGGPRFCGLRARCKSITVSDGRQAALGRQFERAPLDPRPTSTRRIMSPPGAGSGRPL